MKRPTASFGMKTLTRAAIILSLCTPCVALAAPFTSSLSLQGYTGLLNTPNAEVLEEGRTIVGYSNQKNAEWPERVPRGESYFFNAGIFSFLELGGRLTEAPRLMRDLSANVKFQVPFIPKGYYLPDLAFGLGDVGGGASFFKTRYAVATETLGPLRASVGYGTGPDRMKGVFAGAELKALDWVTLVGEYDTRDTNAGIKLSTPGLFGRDVKLQFTAKTALNRNPGNVDLAVSLNFPLSLSQVKEEKVRRHLRGAAPSSQGLEPAPSGAPDAAEWEASGDLRRSRLASLQQHLASLGLQGVRVGAGYGHSAVIVYENNVFNQNELDALGVVLGSATDSLYSYFDRVFVVVKRKGMQVLALSAPLGDLRHVFEEGNDTGLRESLRTEDDLSLGEVDFVGGKTISPYLKPTIVLWPGLTTFVGTEVGLFDYLLSLKADLLLTPWKGATTDIRGDFPLSWSKNLEDRGLYRSARHGDRLERVMQFQALRFTRSLYGMIGVGRILGDTYGTVNELMWSSPEGTHRIRLKQAYAEDTGTKVKRNVYLGSYRYFVAPWNLYLEGTAGRFWERDTGATVELKRYFGDTSLSVYYKNSKTFEGRHWQVGGVQVTFPLTLRKDMKPVVAQVRGTEAWSYAQESVISSGSGNTVLQTGVGMNPEPSVNLQDMYFNRDRLNRGYILENLGRMSEAYWKYGVK